MSDIPSRHHFKSPLQAKSPSNQPKALYRFFFFYQIYVYLQSYLFGSKLSAGLTEQDACCPLHHSLNVLMWLFIIAKTNNVETSEQFTGSDEDVQSESKRRESARPGTTDGILWGVVTCDTHALIRTWLLSCKKTQLTPSCHKAP